jgi:hypothetical protein
MERGLRIEESLGDAAALGRLPLRAPLWNRRISSRRSEDLNRRSEDQKKFLLIF